MQETEAQIRPVADECLTTFAKVADAASLKLQDLRARSGPEAVVRNTWNETAGVDNHRRLTREIDGEYRSLAAEPAIARVLVVDEDGQEAIYYFARAAAPPVTDERLKFASYRSPVGRLAELDVGETFLVTRGGEDVFLEVVERARFQPFLSNQEWDGRNAVLEGEAYGPVTVDSLRALLETADRIDETALDALLSEESDAANVRDGVRRGVVLRMGLRDQPVLDRYQGEIFRMPLRSRLLILGAPGTGKTTTLIRRLGQKLDVVHLDEDERREIRSSEEEHAHSWIMFTPTELLRLYVKEAFNREDIPAPDDRIRTWTELRGDLARNHFRFLRSPTNRSPLVMKNDAPTLADKLELDQRAWFEDFDQWQRVTFWEELRDAAKNLSEHPSADVASLGRRVRTIVDAVRMPQAGAFVSLMPVASDIGALVADMKALTDGKIRGALNLQVNRDREFLDDMASFISELKELPDDDIDQDADEDEDENQPPVGRAAAMAAYLRSMRSLARARARKRNVSRRGPTGRLIEWLGDRTMSDEDLQEVGASLLVQTALRSFTNPVRRYVDRIPARYRRFRRTRQGEGRWYQADGFALTDIHPHEVDVILLSMMRATNELVTGARSLIDMETSARPTLERMTQLYRTQVLVDEATDFSPIQLACMASLARPDTRSFFACGDFNQRVTSWGARSDEDMKWVLPDLNTRRVTVAYRQSQQLHNLARQLVAVSGGSEDDAVLPDFADNEGVRPVLARGLENNQDIASWLAQRIAEIDANFDDLPSIAVLVNTEDAVRPVSDALGDVLADYNISVEACHDGRIKGRDGAVRVFHVEHIKGLEFEAVFFVSIDELAKALPGLFDKYLYVGATRAATYLGMTCRDDLPASMAPLEGLFGEDWS
ncbi:ATP-binding domain-containing protein [Minwuia thermotolerans]|uniref:DNA 3'-5' helicase II n=1 Tax=Minwuia thermotolerans TaxID=2056226 RepID=A0A2M9G090_9PROT|nr:ATP-binding domain-containing protein [Minwuia thermotolerans]PJK29138.1 hypothetical protein CVT23_13145 [Minwuia thermotolerans]